MKKINKGFSLIELLVVISIIGALAAFSMVSFSTSQKQARDAQRKNDIKNYQSLVVSFAAKNKGLYPQRSTATSATTLCGDLGLSSCPLDPKNPDYSYSYCSSGNINTGTAGSTSFVVWGGLESPGTTTYFVTCSNGKSGEVLTQPTCGDIFNCQLP